MIFGVFASRVVAPLAVPSLVFRVLPVPLVRQMTTTTKGY